MRILYKLFHPLLMKLTTEFDLMGEFLEIMANPVDVLALHSKVSAIKDEFPSGYANFLVLEIVTNATEMYLVNKKYQKFATKRVVTAIAVKNMTKKIEFMTQKMHNTNKKIQIFMKKRNITREDGI